MNRHTIRMVGGHLNDRTFPVNATHTQLNLVVLDHRAWFPALVHYQLPIHHDTLTVHWDERTVRRCDPIRTWGPVTSDEW